MVPRNGLEKALMSPVFTEGGIEMNPELEENQKISEFGKLLSQIDSPERIIELQLKLDEQFPYFQISPEEAIRDYFSNFGIPISNKRDLELFSFALAQRVDELDRSDEKVGSALKQRDYRIQLQTLPRILSDLERTVSDFEVLKAPFEAVIRYVWETSQKGFRMKEEGRNALEQYPGKLTIDSGTHSYSITIELQSDNQDVLEFHVTPKVKFDVVEEVRKRRFFRDGRVSKDIPIRTEGFDILPCRIFDRTWGENINNELYDGNNWVKGTSYYITHHKIEGVYNERVSVFGSDEAIDSFVSEMLIDPDSRIQSFQAYLKIFFNLPNIMNNYAERTRTGLKNMLDTTLEGINGEGPDKN